MQLAVRAGARLSLRPGGRREGTARRRKVACVASGGKHLKYQDYSRLTVR